MENIMIKYFKQEEKNNQWEKWTELLGADKLDILDLKPKHFNELSDEMKRKFTSGAYEEAEFKYDYIQRIVRNRIKAFKYPDNVQLSLILSRWWKLPTQKKTKDEFLTMFRDHCDGQDGWSNTTLKNKLKAIIEQVYLQHNVLIENPILNNKKPKDAVAMLGEELWK